MVTVSDPYLKIKGEFFWEPSKGRLAASSWSSSKYKVSHSSTQSFRLTSSRFHSRRQCALVSYILALMDLVAIATLGEIKEANVSLCKLYALAKQLRMQVLDSYLFASALRLCRSLQIWGKLLTSQSSAYAICQNVFTSHVCHANVNYFTTYIISIYYHFLSAFLLQAMLSSKSNPLFSLPACALINWGSL